jgi:RecA-family ATPase
MSGMKTGSSGSTGWNTTTRNSVFMRKPNSNDEDDDAADDGKRELYMSKANYGPQGRRIGLQWAHGVYECTDKPPRPDADIGAASKAERVFLKLLDLCNRRGQPVTSNRAATKTFAPNVFFDSGDREGVTKPALEKAMNALLDRAEIINVKTGSGTREKWHLERAPAVENSNPR